MSDKFNARLTGFVDSANLHINLRLEWDKFQSATPTPLTPNSFDSPNPTPQPW